MTTPQARDVDLKSWLNGFGFHPANTKLKQMGHELTRKAVASLAMLLHWLVPAGREKSLVFTHLELVLMYANKALAVGGGPDADRFTEDDLTAALKAYARVELPEDPRIDEYRAEQRGEAPGQVADAPAGEQRTLGLSGAVVTEAAEPGISGEQPTEAPETFRAEFEDGDVTLKVVGGRGYVALAVTGPQAPVIDPDEDGKFGWYVNLHNPTAVNEVLSAIAAAGDRSFNV